MFCRTRVNTGRRRYRPKAQIQIYGAWYLEHQSHLGEEQVVALWRNESAQIFSGQCVEVDVDEMRTNWNQHHVTISPAAHWLVFLDGTAIKLYHHHNCAGCFVYKSAQVHCKTNVCNVQSGTCIPFWKNNLFWKVVRENVQALPVSRLFSMLGPKRVLRFWLFASSMCETSRVRFRGKRWCVELANWERSNLKILYIYMCVLK